MKLITSAYLIFLAVSLGACSAYEREPYNDPDSQRDRSGQAQDEMRRSRSY